jgi:hypothetical protein
MKSQTLVAAVLAVVLAHCPSAWAQPPYSRPVQEYSSDRSGEAPPAEPMRASRWLTPAPCLCEGSGESPPIAAEVYLQTGASIPINSWFNNADALGRDMRDGFVIQGGLRTMFFNDSATRAWVVDTSISHVSNGQDPTVRYGLRLLEFTGNTDPLTGQPEVKRIQFGTPTHPGLEIRDTHRTFVNLGLGRDYYAWTSAEDPGRYWRFGLDSGGRYGTLSQEYNATKHRTDVIAGYFVGGHSELVAPTRWGTLTVGVRTEWSYTWSSILQRASDIQEINVMMTLGLRY